MNKINIFEKNDYYVILTLDYFADYDIIGQYDNKEVS